MNENKDNIQYPESTEIPVTKTKRFVGARAYSLIKESGLVDEKTFTVEGWKQKFEIPFVKMIYAECGITDAPAEVCNIDGLFASFVEALRIAGMSQESLEKIEKDMKVLAQKDEEVYKKLESLKTSFDAVKAAKAKGDANPTTALSGMPGFGGAGFQGMDPSKLGDLMKGLEKLFSSIGLPKPSVPTTKPPVNPSANV